MRVIRQNLFWAFAYNVVLIPVAMGVLYPIFGIAAQPGPCRGRDGAVVGDRGDQLAAPSWVRRQPGRVAAACQWRARSSGERVGSSLTSRSHPAPHASAAPDPWVPFVAMQPPAEQTPTPTPAPVDPRDLTGPFNHRVSIEVRFADTDAMGHVNNATYLTYCEIARIKYWTDVTGVPIDHRSTGLESLILAEARITYRAPTFYGETVTVETRATKVGRTSFHLEHRLTASAPGGEPRLVAVSDSVLVRYDYAAARPVPLSAEHIGAMEAYEGRTLTAG